MTPNAGETVEKLDLSYITDTNVRWYSHSGKKYGSFLQNSTCAYSTIQQLHSWAFVPEKRKLMSYRNQHMNMHSSFIQNNQTVETTEMFFSGWMVKQTGIPVPKNVYSAKKKERV